MSATAASGSNSGSAPASTSSSVSAALGRLAVDHDQVLQVGQQLAGGQRVGQQRLLGDQDPRAGVGDDELDLLGRVGVVDGERRGAERHRREVGEVELGPVGQQQRHRVAAAHAQARQAGRQRVDALAQLAPRPLDRPGLRSHRDVLGPLVGGDAERLGDGRGVKGGRAVAGARGLHRFSSLGLAGEANAPGSPRRRSGRCRWSAPARTGTRRARSRRTRRAP